VRRRRAAAGNGAVFNLSFLDAMTCGFGAVVLFFMIINASFGRESRQRTGELEAEVDRLEEEVLSGYQKLVPLRNAFREIDRENVLAAGLSRRLLETLEEVQLELATFEDSTLSKEEHVNTLMSDLRSLEDEVKRLSAMASSDETPGDKVRARTGDGDRQYLTGLKVGGRRILVLVDASASMLGETVVDAVRRRHLPESDRRRAAKWRQAVSTVDWLTTQFPPDSQFQIYLFDTTARPVIAGTEGRWLRVAERAKLNEAVDRLRATAPNGGTSLINAFAAIRSLQPAPDNLYLLVDGLPTQGRTTPRRSTVSGKERARLFDEAVRALPRELPVNTILFPMEGDPLASSAYWKLALGSGGAYVSPSPDWP
jgi:hypothetical protein